MEIDASWKASRLVQAELRPKRTAVHSLRLPAGQRLASVACNDRAVAVKTHDDGTAVLELEAGKLYRLT